MIAKARLARSRVFPSKPSVVFQEIGLHTDVPGKTRFCRSPAIPQRSSCFGRNFSQDLQAESPKENAKTRGTVTVVSIMPQRTVTVIKIILEILKTATVIQQRIAPIFYRTVKIGICWICNFSYSVSVTQNIFWIFNFYSLPNSSPWAGLCVRNNLDCNGIVMLIVHIRGLGTPTQSPNEATIIRIMHHDPTNSADGQV